MVRVRRFGAGLVMRRQILLGAAAACVRVSALAADTARTRPARIGLLGYGSAAGSSTQANAFRVGLGELGWVEGRNAQLEVRSAGDRVDRLPALAAELVQVGVDVLVVSGTIGIRAARATTHTVPVVFVVLIDPVEIGFVESLAHPGGNMTGVASQFELLITKQLQLLKEALPGLTRIALLKHASDTTTTSQAAEAAARELGLQASVIIVDRPDGFEEGFRAAKGADAGAMQVLPSSYFSASRLRLIELAARYKLPAFYEFRNYVRDGGLMSYGPNIDGMFHLAASYVDRILRGAEPGRLPIERPSKFEFVVNRRTASQLGLVLPASLLMQIDELID
jgi:putative ABC transport system substrate-binding protein